MKKYILIFFLFLLTHVAFSQNSTDLSFLPLIPIDTLSTKEEIVKHQLYNELEGDSFFVKEWVDRESTLQKALFYKQGTICIVYQLPNDGLAFSPFELSDNNRFITYTKQMTHGANNHYESSRDFYIIDLANRTVLSFKSLLATENSEKKPTVESQCQSQIELKGDIVSVKTTCTKNVGYKKYFQADCLPSGKYQIANEKLVRIISKK